MKRKIPKCGKHTHILTGITLREHTAISDLVNMTTNETSGTRPRKSRFLHFVHLRVSIVVVTPKPLSIDLIMTV